MLLADIIKRYRIPKGNEFRFADIDPGDTCGIDIEKNEAKALLAEGAKRLGALQDKLYAEHQWAILVILQGLDAAGKDGVIAHVMAGVNPQGCDVTSFKAPSQLSSITISFGGRRWRCPGAGTSGFLTAPITRRCW